MLTLYLVALGIGGTLLVVSLAFGSDDHHDGLHGHGDSHGVEGMDALMSWLPLSSLRFWTFFAAFFGLTGALFVFLDLIDNALVTTAVATGVGYVTGVGAVRLLRMLRANQTTSSLTPDDYVGVSAIVMVPVTKDKVGKVRLEVKGRSVEMLAKTEDETVLAAKQSVVVYGVTDDGQVLVTAGEQFGESGKEG